MLTDTELMLVCGGNARSSDNTPPPPDVVVIGEWDPWGDNPGPGGGGNGDDLGDNPYAGGNGGPTPEPQRSWRDPDCAAESIKKIIDTRINADRWEYGAKIWMDTHGNVYHGDVFTSEAPGYVDLRQVPFPDGFIPLATVHSHPHMVIQNPSNPSVAYPSGNPALAAVPSHIDMQGMYNYVQSLIAAGFPQAQAENYRIYIKYGDSISEYIYRDQDWTKLNEPNPGQATWAKNSGNYNPCQNR